MIKRLQYWPWLTLQIIAANAAIIIALALAWYLAFIQQSNAYSERLMSTFNIESGSLHAMYVEDVERQLWISVSLGLAFAITASIGLAIVIARPLRTLAMATERLRRGDYLVRTSIKKGEVGRLAEHFNALACALEQEERRRTQFMSDLGHELRTPMTSIRSFAEILQGAELDKETRTKYAGIIHGETQRLTRLLDDLLDLSVLENGSVILDIATQPLAKTLDQACVAVGAADLQIMRKGDGRRITITTDHGRLAQVFINVISNAAKYCDAPKKQLAIHISQSDGQAVIDFIDNGSGVPPADQDLIFEKFSRTSDAAKAGGAGLGLAISREVLTNLHGSITYLPGQGGAGFRVVVPISFG